MGTKASSSSSLAALNEGLTAELQDIVVRRSLVDLVFTYRKARPSVCGTDEAQLRNTIVDALDAADRAVRCKVHEVNGGLAGGLASKFQGGGVDYLDLHQEAEAALWAAIASWNPFSAPISSWAWNPIRKAVASFVSANEHELSYHDFGIRRDVITARESIEETGTSATAEDIAELLETPVKRVERVLDSLDRQVISLDFQNGTADGSGSSTHEKVAAPVAPAGIGGVDLDLLADVTRDLSVVELAFLLRTEGLDGGPSQSFEQVAVDCGISRETVRRMTPAFTDLVTPGSMTASTDDYTIDDPVADDVMVLPFV